METPNNLFKEKNFSKEEESFETKEPEIVKLRSELKMAIAANKSSAAFTIGKTLSEKYYILANKKNQKIEKYFTLDKNTRRLSENHTLAKKKLRERLGEEYFILDKKVRNRLKEKIRQEIAEDNQIEVLIYLAEAIKFGSQPALTLLFQKYSSCMISSDLFINTLFLASDTIPLFRREFFNIIFSSSYMLGFSVSNYDATSKKNDPTFYLREEFFKLLKSLVNLYNDPYTPPSNITLRTLLTEFLFSRLSPLEHPVEETYQVIEFSQQMGLSGSLYRLVYANYFLRFIEIYPEKFLVFPSRAQIIKFTSEILSDNEEAERDSNLLQWFKNNQSEIKEKIAKEKKAISDEFDNIFYERAMKYAKNHESIEKFLCYFTNISESFSISLTEDLIHIIRSIYYVGTLDNFKFTFNIAQRIYNGVPEGFRNITDPTDENYRLFGNFMRFYNTNFQPDSMLFTIIIPGLCEIQNFIVEQIDNSLNPLMFFNENANVLKKEFKKTSKEIQQIIPSKLEQWNLSNNTAREEKKAAILKIFSEVFLKLRTFQLFIESLYTNKLYSHKANKLDELKALVLTLYTDIEGILLLSPVFAIEPSTQSNDTAKQIEKKSTIEHKENKEENTSSKEILDPPNKEGKKEEDKDTNSTKITLG